MNFFDTKNIVCNITKLSKLTFNESNDLYRNKTYTYESKKTNLIEYLLKPDDVDWMCINKYGQQIASKISPRRWLNKRVWKHKDL